MHVCVHRLNSQLKADLQLSQPVRFVPEADIFFEPELAKFCQNQNR